MTDGSITPQALRWCIEQCIKAGHVDQLVLPGLKPDRKAVLGGGLSILYTLAMHFDIEVMRPARGALRQGVIFDLDDRIEATRDHRQPDPRETSVRELQRRLGILGHGELRRHCHERGRRKKGGYFALRAPF
mgnify:CR=1 FL=1